MRRVPTVLITALCFGCSGGLGPTTAREPTGKPAGTATSVEVSDRWVASDDHVTHVTVVTDKATNREFACFFGEYRGYSYAMSCVQVKP